MDELQMVLQSTWPNFATLPMKYLNYNLYNLKTDMYTKIITTYFEQIWSGTEGLGRPFVDQDKAFKVSFLSKQRSLHNVRYLFWFLYLVSS